MLRRWALLRQRPEWNTNTMKTKPTVKTPSAAAEVREPQRYDDASGQKLYRPKVGEKMAVVGAAADKTAQEWTTPFYGVSHLGKFGIANWWATIEDHGTFVHLNRWFPGCKFEPLRSDFDTLAEAKQQGERWVKRGILNNI